MLLAGSGLTWQYRDGSDFGEKEQGVRLAFHCGGGKQRTIRREATTAVIARILDPQLGLSWIKPSRKEWTIDCDAMRSFFSRELAHTEWLTGIVRMEPEYEERDQETFGEIRHNASIVFYLTPEVLKDEHMTAHTSLPPEIADSILAFQRDHPDSSKTAFIMMRYGTTVAHSEITSGIKTALSKRGIAGLRADDKQYHDDLFGNILTYLYGCGLGVAVFERLETDDFNPNVSLEVGYMLGLRKPVCLLKDRTLKTLHTDLTGRLYRAFDPQHPIDSIASELTQWLHDKGK